jgi:hypothetical protein
MKKLLCIVLLIMGNYLSASDSDSDSEHNDDKKKVITAKLNISKSLRPFIGSGQITQQQIIMLFEERNLNFGNVQSVTAIHQQLIRFVNKEQANNLIHGVNTYEAAQVLLANALNVN